MKFPSVYEGKGFVSNGREFILITRKEKIFLLVFLLFPLSKKYIWFYIFLELDLNCFDKF